MPLYLIHLNFRAPAIFAHPNFRPLIFAQLLNFAPINFRAGKFELFFSPRLLVEFLNILLTLASVSYKAVSYETTVAKKRVMRDFGFKKAQAFGPHLF